MHHLCIAHLFPSDDDIFSRNVLYGEYKSPIEAASAI